MTREIAPPEDSVEIDAATRGLDRNESPFVNAEAVAAIFRGAPPIDLGRFRDDLDAAICPDRA